MTDQRMRRRGRLGGPMVCLAAAALISPTPARATGATWTPRPVVGGRAELIRPITLGFTPDGVGLVGFAAGRGDAQLARAAPMDGSGRARARTLAVMPAGESSVEAWLLPAGRSRMTLLAESFPAGGQSVVWARSAGTGSELGPRLVLEHASTHACSTSSAGHAAASPPL